MKPFFTVPTLKCLQVVFFLLLMVVSAGELIKSTEKMERPVLLMEVCGYIKDHHGHQTTHWRGYFKDSETKVGFEQDISQNIFNQFTDYGLKEVGMDVTVSRQVFEGTQYKGWVSSGVFIVALFGFIFYLIRITEGE